MKDHSNGGQPTAIQFRPPSELAAEQHLRELLEEAIENYGTEKGERAFIRAIQEVHTFVYSYAFRRLRKQSTTEEVLQVATTNAYRNLLGYDPRRPFQPWYIKLVTNALIDHLRSENGRGKARRPSFESLDVERHVIAINGENVGFQIDVERWFAKLAPECRDLLLYRMNNDLTVKELAELLGKSTGWIYKRLRELEAQLRGLM